ncbi:hypothetical protein ABBQ38_013498 [Trebouxia sp. C0009 RCD-2024]
MHIRRPFIVESGLLVWRGCSAFAVSVQLALAVGAPMSLECPVECVLRRPRPFEHARSSQHWNSTISILTGPSSGLGSPSAPAQAVVDRLVGEFCNCSRALVIKPRAPSSFRAASMFWVMSLAYVTDSEVVRPI